MKSSFVIRNEDNYDIEAANRKEMYIDECQYEDILYQVNKAKLFNHFKFNRECTENNIYCKKKNVLIQLCQQKHENVTLFFVNFD